MCVCVGGGGGGRGDSSPIAPGPASSAMAGHISKKKLPHPIRAHCGACTSRLKTRQSLIEIVFISGQVPHLAGSPEILEVLWPWIIVMPCQMQGECNGDGLQLHCYPSFKEGVLS